MPMTPHQKLLALCSPFQDYPLHSRVHRMRTYDLYIKRDDELGFGMSGSKIRKYASLIPWLKKQEKKTIALTGSPYSNHILSFVSLLKQEGLLYRLFLEKPRSLEKKGNFFFLSLLIDPKEISWFDTLPASLSPSWMQEQESSLQEEFLWIPIGGSMKEGFFGTLTLALDILENEKTLKKEFSHIFIDSGSGTTAAGLILGMRFLQRNTNIYTVLIAGKEEEFQAQLLFFQKSLEEALGEKITSPINNIFLTPPTAKSFGSSNKQIFTTIRQVAKEEGIFLDPIYTSKLLLTATTYTQTNPLQGEVLLIHSGGSLSLTGFQKQLESLSYF